MIVNCFRAGYVVITDGAVIPIPAVMKERVDTEGEKTTSMIGAGSSQPSTLHFQRAQYTRPSDGEKRKVGCLVTVH